MIILRILLKIFQVLLWILLILLLAILLIPFSYKLRAISKEEKKSVWADVHWLFGLLGVKGTYEYGLGFEGVIRILGIPIKVKEENLAKWGKGKGKEKKKEKKAKDKKEKEKKKSNRTKVFTIEALQYLLGRVSDVLHHVLPRRIEGYGILGFDDPYNTGLVSAVIESLRGIGVHHMNIQYAFDREVYEGEIYMEGRIVIIYFVYIAIRLLLHKSSRDLLLGIRRKSYGI